MRNSYDPKPGLPLLAGIVAAAMMDSVAGASMSMARLDLMGDLYTSSDEFAWLDISYTTAKLFGFMAAPALFARWLPLRGFRGAAWGMIGACGLMLVSSDIRVLGLARAAQGLACGLLLAGGQALLFQIFSRKLQYLVQSFYALGVVMGTAFLAPALQGWLVDSFSWPLIFICAMGLGFLSLTLLYPVAGDIVPKKGLPRSGCAGPALLLAAFFCLTYVLQMGSRWNWWEAGHIKVLTVVGLVCFILFFLRQIVEKADSTRPRPLVDGRVFRDENFIFALPLSMISGAVLLGGSYLIGNLCLNVLHMTAFETGRMLVPGGLMFILALALVIVVSGRLRLPPLAMVPLGILFTMAAFWLLSGANSQSGPGDLSLGLAVRAAGLGWLFLPMAIFALSGLKGEINTQGVAVFNTLRQVGGMLAIAVLQHNVDVYKKSAKTVLSAHLSDGDPLLLDRLGQVGRVMENSGLDSDQASQGALAHLAQSLESQASVLSFNDAFYSLAAMFLVLIPSVLLFKVWLGRRYGKSAASQG